MASVKTEIRIDLSTSLRYGRDDKKGKDMPKTIILGALGTLGQELVKVFAQYKPMALDKDELDITDQKSVAAFITKEKPKLVINAAAYNDVDGCENPDKLKTAQKVNSLAPKYLALATAKVKAKLIHYSTDYVFPGSKPEGYLETDKPKPINAYGQTKLAGEQAVQENNPDHYIIRTTRIFGSPAKGVGAKKSFIDLMLELALKNDILKVVDEERSCPTYAKDLAVQTQYLVSQGLPTGIYHVTNAGACTWYEFAQEIFKIIKKQVELMPVPASTFPRPAKRPAHSRLLNTKLPPMRPWQEALGEHLSLSSRP